MKRVFLISDDDEFAKWIEEELINYARIIRRIESAEFFLQQWKTTEAEIIIMVDSVIESEEAFIKAHDQIIMDSPNTVFVMIHLDQENAFVKKLKEKDLICIAWDDLDFKLIETRIERFYSIKNLHSSFVVDIENHFPIEVDDRDISIAEDSVKDEQYTENLQNALKKTNEVLNHLDLPVEKEDKVIESSPEKLEDPDNQLDTRKSDEVIEKTSSLKEVDEDTLQPRNHKPKGNRIPKPKLLSLPKHGEVREKIIISERIVGTVLIAIAGTCRGAGSTHNAIQIAKYLSGNGFEVACVEMVDCEINPPVFKYLMDGNSKSSKVDNGFHSNGIDFYKEVDPEKYIQIISARYQYVVVDLGQIITNINNKPTEGLYFKEFFRSNISIISTRSAVWDFVNLVKFIDKLLANSWSNQCNVLVNLSDDQRYKYLTTRFTGKQKKDLQLDFSQNSFSPDPFTKVENSIFEALLESIIPKTKKKKIGLFSYFADK